MDRRLLSFLILGFWVVAASVFGAEPAAGNARTKILLIGHDKDGHPYRTHEYLPVSELLAKCLRQTDGVEAVVSKGWPSDPAAAEGVDAIALYVPWGANVLFDGPQREQVKKMLEGGAGLAAIHWSTGAMGAEYGQLWLDQMGAWFHTDFSPIQHLERRLHLVDPAHPICRGLEDFTLFDEFYFNLRFAPDAKPLITVELDGKPQTIAWTYERPHAHGGRSFGCDAGHYHKNYGNDLFRRALVNGILWTARREIPAEGAPAAVAPNDLELPPPAKPEK